MAPNYSYSTVSLGSKKMIDDLTQYLNKKADLLEKKIRDTGFDPMFEKADPELKDDLGYFSPISLGIEAIIGADGLINTIFIHSENYQNFCGFKGDLPEGLEFKMGRKSIRKLLGQPESEGGPIDPIVGKEKIYWDRWVVNRFKLHCTYSADLKQIRMVTITRIKAQQVGVM